VSRKRYAKRMTRFLYRNCETALAKVKALSDAFVVERYPEQHELLELIGSALVMAQDLVRQFHISAWGSEPSDWFMDYDLPGSSDGKEEE